MLDMLRYHLLYMGELWAPEYGDPEDPDMRGVLLSYSPYHNMPRPPAKLPPTIIYMGLNDDRVHPAHAFKYYLKAGSLGHGDVYLRVEKRSGHSGATVEVKARELADMLAYILLHVAPREA